MARVLQPGIFPRHQFAFLGTVTKARISLRRERSFEVPSFARDVFEELLARKMHGKALTRRDRNIIHVDSISVWDDEYANIQAQRCDYAAYLGLALSADEVLSDGGTLLARWGWPLYRVASSEGACVTMFAPLGCTLGLCGMVVSRDGHLITKKKGAGTHTATGYGRRLHLAASQIRFDYLNLTCYDTTGDPLPVEQVRELLATREATPAVAEACSIEPCAVGIFLKDHHPELFFHIVCDLPHNTILEEVKRASRYEGDPEAISVDDALRWVRIACNEPGEWRFADHHAGGTVLLLHHLWAGDEKRQVLLDPFLPTEPLPQEFS